MGKSQEIADLWRLVEGLERENAFLGRVVAEMARRCQVWVSGNGGVEHCLVCQAREFCQEPLD